MDRVDFELRRVGRLLPLADVNDGRLHGHRFAANRTRMSFASGVDDGVIQRYKELFNSVHFDTII